MVTVGTPANSLRAMTVTILGELDPRTRPLVPVAPPETGVGAGAGMPVEPIDVVDRSGRVLPEAEAVRNVGDPGVGVPVATVNAAMTATTTVRTAAGTIAVEITEKTAGKTAVKIVGNAPPAVAGRNAEMFVDRVVAMTGATTAEAVIRTPAATTAGTTAVTIAVTTGGAEPQVLARPVRALGKVASGGSLAASSGKGLARTLVTGGNRAVGTNVARNGSLVGIGPEDRATGMTVATTTEMTVVTSAGMIGGAAGARTGATVSVVDLGMSEELRVVSETMRSANRGWWPPRWTATSQVKNWIARPNIRSVPWNRSTRKPCPSTW